MNESPQSQPSTAPKGEHHHANIPPAPRRGGCLRAFLVVGGVAFLFVGLWVVIRAINGAANQPDVDPNKIKPIEIGSSDPDPSNTASTLPAGKGRIARYLRDNPPAEAEHPLDPLMVMARGILEYIETDIDDYTATMVNRERIRGKLLEDHYMACKIRHETTTEAGETKPFAVYLTYLRPEAARGREVIWVEGENDGNLIAHEGGLKNLLTVRLKPDGMIAMMNSRYPIMNIGIKHLMSRLIEIGERDRQLDADKIVVDVQYGMTINDRPCTRVEVRHLEQRPDSDFRIAEIYIDDELDLPIRYSAYDWPENEGDESPLIEQYTYLDVELNVGLTDADFDPQNPDYQFR